MQRNVMHVKSDRFRQELSNEYLLFACKNRLRSFFSKTERLLILILIQPRTSPLKACQKLVRQTHRFRPTTGRLLRHRAAVHVHHAAGGHPGQVVAELFVAEVASLLMQRDPLALLKTPGTRRIFSDFSEMK